MRPPLSPPASRLPSGASSWILLEELAKVLQKEVRTIRLWCSRQLVYCEALAGGIGGVWIAVADGYWPIPNPAGVDAYRKRRSASARVGSLKGTPAAIAARAKKRTSRRVPASKGSA